MHPALTLPSQHDIANDYKTDLIDQEIVAAREKLAKLQVKRVTQIKEQLDTAKAIVQLLEKQLIETTGKPPKSHTSKTLPKRVRLSRAAISYLITKAINRAGADGLSAMAIHKETNINMETVGNFLNTFWGSPKASRTVDSMADGLEKCKASGNFPAVF